MSTFIEPSQSQQPLELRLANGLRVRWVHLPDACLAAALIEVQGGSHDEPDAFPGLAHYLEHLVFLGSRGFAAGDGLIPFVQGLGGRVNASTQARHTRFFCEVPAAHLEPALERLVDMLAHPLLDEAALWREREVLQAEYSARAQDPQTLCEAALAWALAPGHPLAAFHAGNAASLALESLACIPALRAFHGDHYQPGRMCLTLVGPQSPEVLLALARRHGDPLQAGRPLPDPVPPPLLPLRANRLRLGVPGGSGRLLLSFVLDDQGHGLEAAVFALERLLVDESPGGLQARLGALGLSDGLRLRLPYAHAGQGLLVMELERVEGADCAQLEAEVLGWLAFLRAEPAPEFWEGRLADLRRQSFAQAPLEIALAPAPARPADMRSLLGQLRAERMIRLETGKPRGAPSVVSAGFPLDLECLNAVPGKRSDATWRLPLPNPYLNLPVSVPAMASIVPVLPGPANVAGQGALYLRWSPEARGLPQGLAHGLQRALRPIIGAAGEAGLRAELQAEQGGLSLVLLGKANVLRRVAEDSLATLKAPPLWALIQGPRLQREAQQRAAGELPIRQLLQHLPDRLAGAPIETAAVLSPEQLSRFWRQARWQGLGIGEVALDQQLPGQPAPARVQVEEGGRFWHALEGGGEAALLLFYPLDPPTPEDEAAWRLLGRMMEPAFHQRLRGELQLGYALACGFRQVDRQRGVLFAIQSPRASVTELLGHVEAFLAQWHLGLMQLNSKRLQELARSLDQQLARQAASFPEHARQCWLDRLAGLPDGHAEHVRHALAGLSPQQLLAQHGRLIAARSCHALANAESPSPEWRTRT
ncbi:pyrroloquinoline quinone biosynthesis protein PqqF [Pseudomonas sp. MOB-449]|nr:pyrroloquinoline quinone biosynthesis protein PqqF [Pseudomonas sp. MOB-449]